ncbi:MULTISPECIES: hypothetical protein [unclassified Spirosoma]|uniref:peptidoglycan-binding domain-containing protein n=1 Tax=unclassified Spirosoma TaxID=2621999 RepID=UPI0009645485|nr:MULTISPECIES: hypothetical protein [unclassified Spirosoma]MBN8821879.1 hypothetical protein [Spirosoma sp.]OJW80637.1 MAG: hypothetical protein BGO59_34795 [Spirosoma sp. 48-14]
MERNLLVREVGALSSPMIGSRFRQADDEVFLNPSAPYEVHVRNPQPNAVRRDLGSGRSFRLNENGMPTRSNSTSASAFLTQIVDWLDVGNTNHKRYLGLNYKGKPATWCNIFANDYAYLAGVYLPHFFWRKLPSSPTEASSQKNTNYLTELDANSLYEWFGKYGAMFGWQEITPSGSDYTAVQNTANQGNVVFVSIKRPGIAGHIAAIVPETGSHKALRNSSGQVTNPLLSQAGSHTKNVTYSTTKWWVPRGGQFRIWAHALSTGSGPISTFPNTQTASNTQSAQPASTVSINSSPTKRVKANRYYGQQLGWDKYVDQINDLLLPYSGQSNVSLGEDAFADALAIWQRIHGLTNDGILGPTTWALLKTSLGIATRIPTNSSPSSSASVPAGSPSLPDRFRVLVPALEKYRGNWPLSFLLGWIKKESDGSIHSHTSLDERGYFQLHPDESKTLGIDHQRLSTDSDYSIQAGIQLVNHRGRSAAKYAAMLGIPTSGEVYLALTKLMHWLPYGVQCIVEVMKTKNFTPTSWESFKGFCAANRVEIQAGIARKGKWPLENGIKNTDDVLTYAKAFKK